MVFCTNELQPLGMENSEQNGEDMQETTTTWSRGRYFWLFYSWIGINFKEMVLFLGKGLCRPFWNDVVVPKIDFVCWQTLRMWVLWGFVWVPVILLVVSCFYLLLLPVFCFLLCSLFKVIVQLLSCSKELHLCRLLGFFDLRAPPSQLQQLLVK